MMKNTIEDIAKSEAFEFKVDYKPFKTDLDYREYAEFGFEKGFIAGNDYRRKWMGLLDIELNHTKELLSSCETALEGRDNQINHMYGECDMRLAWEDGRKFEYDHNGGEGGEFIGAESFDEWLKQFKKK